MAQPRLINARLKVKLLIVTFAMFGFGYALVPFYKAMCQYIGINVLARGDANIESAGDAKVVNTQVDPTRTITVEFDSNVRGPWYFKPAVSSVNVHPGQLVTVNYEFQNMQTHRMTAQAIPSYAPLEAGANFHKIECFCFQQYTLEPGERRTWPVVFVVDPKLSDDVKTITLSYTFFEVGVGVPPAPQTNVSSGVPTLVTGKTL
jgi:cytochrome c oxidase assembly protein subunit 11